MILWNNDTEIQFFTEALKNFASPEKVFYKLKDGYFAYIPVGVSSEKKTLQSRNSLIGHFTENWARNLFAGPNDFLQEILYAFYLQL